MRKPDKEQERAYQMQRMLQWFKAQLPPHELDRWCFMVEPHNWSPRDDIYASVRDRQPTDKAYMFGEARCGRCERYFRMKRTGFMGDGGVYISDQRDSENLQRVEAEVRERVQRLAEVDGECWGDIPHAPHEDDYGRVVLD